MCYFGMSSKCLAHHLRSPRSRPSSIQALTCGCTLLLSGSIADAVGARFMYLAGTLLQTAFVLGCGLSRNALEIILFRGLSGVAVSFCLPSAVSIITSSFVGNRRNMAFAFMGGGQPAGFVVGLVLGGVLTDFVSWRVGFYASAALTGFTFALIFWGLPPSASSADELSWKQRWQQISHEIDWIGAMISSTSLATLSYVFAYVSSPPIHNIATDFTKVRLPATCPTYENHLALHSWLSLLRSCPRSFYGLADRNAWEDQRSYQTLYGGTRFSRRSASPSSSPGVVSMQVAENVVLDIVHDANFLH